MHNVAYCDLELGRFEEADEAFGRALQIFREQANGRGEAMVLSSLGTLARRRGDLERAQELSRASLALAERMGNAGAVADATDDLAQVVEKLGDLPQAQALYERALVMARELRQVHLECFVLLHLARTQAAASDIAASARSLGDALSLAHARNFQTGRLMGILGAAGLRVRRGDRDGEAVASRWCGAVLAVAGSNADVRDAIQGMGAAFIDLLDVTRPDSPPTIDAAAAEVLEFLNATVE